MENTIEVKFKDINFLQETCDVNIYVILFMTIQLFIKEFIKMHHLYHYRNIFCRILMMIQGKQYITELLKKTKSKDKDKAKSVN